MGTVNRIRLRIKVWTVIADQIYTSYRPGDSVQIYFLCQSGNMVGIPGMPPQTLWRTVGAFQLEPPEATPRKWEMSPYLGSKIR